MLLCGSFSKLAHAVLDVEVLCSGVQNTDRPVPMEDVAHPDRLLVVPSAQERAYATRIAEWARRKVAGEAGAPILHEAIAAEPVPHPTAGAPGLPVVRPQRPLLRIGEIVEGQFCDLLGMVGMVISMLRLSDFGR